MRYAVIALLVGGVLIAGCGLGDRVELLTGGNGACYAGGGEGTPGRLVAEGEYGTTYNGQPVMWPDGYIGRRAGAEVEVLDADGDVRATTGRFYRIMPTPDLSEEAERAGAIGASVDCGYPWYFVDLGTTTPPSIP